LCRDLGYKIEYSRMATEAEDVGRMLHGLIGSIEPSRQRAPL
jgi:hypothetical protein